MLRFLPRILIVSAILVFPLLADTPLKVRIDYAQFSGDRQSSLVEIYYSMTRSGLKHIAAGDELVAKYEITLTINYKDSTLKTSSWQGIDKVQDITLVNDEQTINDVYQLRLGAGTFEFALGVTDINSGKFGQAQMEAIITPKPGDNIRLSNTQLALNIVQSQEKNRFTKNGYQILPNPARVYNLKWPMLFSYSEIYPPASIEADSSIECRIQQKIIDINGNLIKKLPDRSRQIRGAGIVHIEKALVSSLTSGVYWLQIDLLDQQGQRISQNKSKFYVYRAADFVQKSGDSDRKDDDLYTIYISFEEEALDKEFTQAKYIATGEEKGLYKHIGLDGKREFLADFWIRRGKPAGESGADFRSQYLERVEYANDQYTSGGTEGWKTDRGRVVILYGVPDDIERFRSGSETKRHEIWTYNSLENGVDFIFIDVSGYGRFRLVHSTMLNEIKDYEWKVRYLR